jgi:predicted component of type VI protein secretion system
MGRNGSSDYAVKQGLPGIVLLMSGTLHSETLQTSVAIDYRTIADFQPCRIVALN